MDEQKKRMKRSQKQERLTAKQLGMKRQPASGSQWHSPGDVKGQRFLIDNKTTEKKSYSLKAQDIRKIMGEALFADRDWCLQIDFEDPAQKPIRVAVVPYHILEELEGDI